MDTAVVPWLPTITAARASRINVGTTRVATTFLNAEIVLASEQVHDHLDMGLRVVPRIGTLLKRTMRLAKSITGAMYSPEYTHTHQSTPGGEPPISHTALDLARSISLSPHTDLGDPQPKKKNGPQHPVYSLRPHTHTKHPQVVTLQWLHAASIGGCVLPTGQEKVLCSTTTSVDALAVVIVPHGGEVSFSSAADSATPLMAFLRIVCQRVKGPG